MAQRIEFEANHHVQASAQQDDDHWRERDHFDPIPCPAPNEVGYVYNPIGETHRSAFWCGHVLEISSLRVPKDARLEPLSGTPNL